MRNKTNLERDLALSGDRYSLFIDFENSLDARLTPFAIRPYAPAPPGEQKRHRHQNHCEAPENRVPPIYANVAVHGPNKKRERACEHCSEKHVGRYGAGAVPRERVHEVVKRRLEYGRKTDAGEEDTDDRRPIVYFGI